MGWSEREYAWSLYSPRGTTPAVRMLLIVTVAVFVGELILGWARTSIFCLVPRLALLRLCLWQFVTYIFLHDPGNLFHIIFNMLLLYWLGPGVERIIGSRRFVWFYLGAGAFAGLIHSIVDIVFFSGGEAPVVGASGSIMALMVLYAIYYPNQMILVFLIFPMKIKHCVLLLIAIDLFYTLQPGVHRGVATVAHLGGAAFGYLYYKFGGRFGTMVQGWAGDVKQSLEQRRERHDLEEDELVDQLLEKISREGMGSLTEAERNFLTDASRRRRRRD